MVYGTVYERRPQCHPDWREFESKLARATQEALDAKGTRRKEQPPVLLDQGPFADAYREHCMRRDGPATRYSPPYQLG